MSQGGSGRACDSGACCPETVCCQDSSAACAAFWRWMSRWPQRDTSPGAAQGEGLPRLRHGSHAVLRETREETFEGPLPNLIVNSRCTLFLQDCVAVNPQDVVDTADAQTFSKEGELCLRILAELDALVHCGDDICHLLRSWSVMDCRDPTATPSVMPPAVTAEVLARLRTSPIFLSGGCCVQVVHIVNDLSVFIGFRSAPNSGIGNVEFLQKRQHQDWMAHDVTVVHVPLICQASILLQRTLRIMGSGVFFMGSPAGSFADSRSLAEWSACSRCSCAESLTPIQGRAPAACPAAMLPRVSAATIPRAKTALQGAVNVSLLSTLVLRH